MMKNNCNKKKQKSSALNRRAPPVRFVIPRNIPLVIEPFKWVRLRYTDETQSRFQSANSWNFFMITANGLYDPDPIVGGGTPSAFAAYGNFFRQYRVLSAKYTWTVINPEDNPPLSLFVSISQNVLPATTKTQLIDMSETHFASRVKAVSNGSGINKVSFSGLYRMDSLIGTSAWTENDNRGSFVSGGANPPQPVYIAFCAFGASGIASPVYSDLRIEYFVQLFDRQAYST